MLLSFLWAFWWPPSACDLRNFLLQKRQGKSLESLAPRRPAEDGEEDEAKVRERSTLDAGGGGDRGSDSILLSSEGSGLELAVCRWVSPTIIWEENDNIMSGLPTRLG